MIRSNESTPAASAAALLPNAAGANRSVFYHPDGSAKSVREVYDWTMQQPGASAPVRAPEALQSAVYRASNASSANIEGLLASVMNWQPSHNFYAPTQANFGDQTPTSPLRLTPGLLGLLSES